MARAIMMDRIRIKLTSTTGNLFKKKINPGLEKEIEIKIKKILIGIVTFSLLKYVDQRQFVTIYLKKIKPLLDEILGISITQQDILDFVDIVGVDNKVIDYSHKEIVGTLINQLSRLNFETELSEVTQHANRFLEKFDYLKLTIGNQDELEG